MSKKIPQLWARQGKVEIFDVGWGYYVVRFKTLADQDRACFGGPWMVILTTIGNRIGKTIRIDHTTLQGNRGNFARIYVEVDLAKPLVSKYRLRHRVRRVEYEGLHVICFSCGCYGHQQEHCPSTKGQEEEVIVTNSFENPIFQKEMGKDERPEVLEEFGPWMLVKRANRKGKAAEKSSSPPTGVKIPATEFEKGNRFGALIGEAEKETADVETDADFATKSVHLSSDSAHSEKENVDPNHMKSNGKKSTNFRSKEPASHVSSAHDESTNGPNNSKKPEAKPAGAEIPIQGDRPAIGVQGFGQPSKKSMPTKGPGKTEVASLGGSSGPQESTRKKSTKSGGSSLPPGGKLRGLKSTSVEGKPRPADAVSLEMEIDLQPIAVTEPKESSGSMECS
ncbi:hypothetical protein LINPERHAP2_LOCUS24091 [Linum perenne]